ncbi:hypothetical protein VTN02DRAFT_4592 [Thermoascus thermophilus]
MHRVSDLRSHAREPGRIQRDGMITGGNRTRKSLIRNWERMAQPAMQRSWRGRNPSDAIRWDEKLRKPISRYGRLYYNTPKGQDNTYSMDQSTAVRSGHIDPGPKGRHTAPSMRGCSQEYTNRTSWSSYRSDGFFPSAFSDAVRGSDALCCSAGCLLAVSAYARWEAPVE